jgi:hypothetical protein
MKRWIAPIVAFVMVGMLGLACANADAAAKADKKKDKKGGNVGMIQEIKGKTLSVTLGKGKKATKTDLTIADDASITLDGQKSDINALKAGLYVKVDATSGTVKNIDATTKAPDKGEKKKKKAA